jgi:hypothetical protein
MEEWKNGMVEEWMIGMLEEWKLARPQPSEGGNGGIPPYTL